MARVIHSTHEGKPVIHLSLRDLKPGEFKPVFEEATRTLGAMPLKSARVVTEVSGARFDAGTIVEFEKFISAVTPHCLCNAIVGITGIQRVAWLGLKAFYKCPAELHDTVPSGKDWVARFG
jgi:hypothetical protein